MCSVSFVLPGVTIFGQFLNDLFFNDSRYFLFCLMKSGAICYRNLIKRMGWNVFARHSNGCSLSSSSVGEFFDSFHLTKAFLGFIAYFGGELMSSTLTKRCLILSSTAGGICHPQKPLQTLPIFQLNQAEKLIILHQNGEILICLRSILVLILPIFSQFLGILEDFLAFLKSILIFSWLNFCRFFPQII